MRIPAVIMLLALSSCAGFPSINPAPTLTADRSWVPADAVIYGMDLPHGFFRFALNQQQPEKLGNTAGFLPEALDISPDKSLVYANSNGPGSYEPHFIYNTRTCKLHDLGPLIPPYSLPEISPDWHYIAWTSAYFPGLHIVDLQTSTARTVQLPGPGWTIGTAWSSSGDVLAVQRPLKTGAWTYWKIHPVTGDFTSIQGQSQNSVLIYTENGQNIGVACPLCDAPRPARQIITPSGAIAYISKIQDLVVKDPDGTLNIVEKHIAPPTIPAGAPVCDCGPEGKYPAPWTIFDGDVLLYSFGRELWVYGIAEHQKSPLGISPVELVF